MAYQDQINLDVNRAIILRSATTRWYKMDSNPRGKAVIFVQDIKYTTEPIVVDLGNEGLRFKHIFNQLGYDTQVHMRKSSTEIMSTLNEYATSEHPGDSFIVMFTGHGFNGNICGNDNYEHDVLPIQNVLDLFSEKNCLALQSKPKVFLFNCCRESYAAYCNGIEMYTYFGRALSHTPAQFASYKSLDEIIKKTTARLESDLAVVREMEPTDDNQHNPEFQTFGVQKDLYFNPGL
ncbi:unnamed protein product [Oppiella nova]|uniref:Caspase family p20 domain-containing protein n=1 Tax=Oppiella nova TaxID=334625 RepID=A0A7R9M5R1_9ACAR|nr:unnamed protein product [Oppiella nova]CAG2169991.1 unnamed protein product [Oppiella nova]